MRQPAPFEMTVFCARRETKKVRSCVDAVAFFVFFTGAAGAGVVAAYFGAGANGFGGFGLGGAGLVLQFFLLAFLLALHLAGEFGETLGRAAALATAAPARGRTGGVCCGGRG